MVHRVVQIDRQCLAIFSDGPWIVLDAEVVESEIDMGAHLRHRCRSQPHGFPVELEGPRHVVVTARRLAGRCQRLDVRRHVFPVTREAERLFPEPGCLQQIAAILIDVTETLERRRFLRGQSELAGQRLSLQQQLRAFVGAPGE